MSKTEKKEQISPMEHVFASQKSQKYVEISELMIKHKYESGKLDWILIWFLRLYVN